jgi:hypothetical protein
MLILSCRIHEKFYFPGSQTSVRVLEIQPGSVRLGIDAPAEGAFSSRDFQDPNGGTRAGRRSRDTKAAYLRRQRRACRRLKAASMRLGMARLQLRVGLAQNAQLALEHIQQEIQALRRCLEGNKKQPARRPDTPPRTAGDRQDGTVGVLASCPR